MYHTSTEKTKFFAPGLVKFHSAVFFTVLTAPTSVKYVVEEKKSLGAWVHHYRLSYLILLFNHGNDLQLGASFLIMPHGKFGFKHDATGQRNYFGKNSNEQPISKSF